MNLTPDSEKLIDHNRIQDPSIESSPSIAVARENGANDFNFEANSIKSQISWGYLTGQIATVCIGTIMFGYSITAWNVSETGYFVVSFP